jgi:tRNA pseudouridine38-40 synthase
MEPEDPIPVEAGTAARNIRLTIAYLGTAYCGWQVQPRSPTVQGAIEEKLLLMTREPVRLRAAGRTDAGVHALGQVANFRTGSSLSTGRILRGLNALLPPDISILSAEEVDPAFDSRRGNRGKHYRYSIWNHPLASPAVGATTLHVHRPLDLPAMARASLSLVGTHDFAAFRAASCDCETTVRTLYRCTVAREGPMVAIDVEGTAFLRNMVRIIAGTLLAIGQGAGQPALVDELLSGGDRTRAGMTLPPHGLCLVRVFVD